jgi:hypothetical protein
MSAPPVATLAAREAIVNEPPDTALAIPASTAEFTTPWIPRWFAVKVPAHGQVLEHHAIQSSCDPHVWNEMCCVSVTRLDFTG